MVRDLMFIQVHQVLCLKVANIAFKFEVFRNSVLTLNVLFKLDMVFTLEACSLEVFLKKILSFFAN